MEAELLKYRNIDTCDFALYSSIRVKYNTYKVPHRCFPDHHVDKEKAAIAHNSCGYCKFKTATLRSLL